MTASEAVNQKVTEALAELRRVEDEIKSRQAQSAQLTQELSSLALYRAELSGRLKFGSELLPELQPPAEAPAAEAPPAEGGKKNVG